MTIFWPISEPTTSASCHGTPITQATGASTQPSRVDRLVGLPINACSPVTSPSQVSGAFKSAISAINASSIAPILSASFSPSAAPAAAASIRLLAVFSTSILTEPRVSGSPVSGTRIFAITSVAGAAITEAANKCLA